jgi:hypothetical protein
MMIYQYRRSIDGTKNFGYFIDLLKDGKMKFGKPSEFNDPFDCCPSVIPHISGSTLPDAAIDEVNRSRQSIVSAIYGIACFTTDPDKMLMWSHYGNQHRSVCVGFDSEILNKNIPLNDRGNPLYAGIDKVHYTNDRPTLQSNNYFNNKSSSWEYENEFRIISQEKRGSPSWGPGVFCLPVNSIKEVIIGARVIPTMIEKISVTVKRLAPNVKLKIAVPHPTKFDLKIISIKDFPNVARSSAVVSGANDNWHHT